MFCDSTFPHVIYRSYIDWGDERGTEYREKWARQVDDFFSYVSTVNQHNFIQFRPRFSLNFDNNLIHPLKRKLVSTK